MREGGLAEIALGRIPPLCHVVCMESVILFLRDESGDYGLASINPQNPVFVLIFCIF